MVRVPYKTFPLVSALPAFSSVKEIWYPIVNVAISYRHITSKRFEAVVDSGSPFCLFHSDIGRALGIPIEEGGRDTLKGIAKDASSDAYFHEMQLKLVADTIPIIGGFIEDLPVAAILGRNGFFDNFVITFDPCSAPPGLALERVHRA
jgi:hypothetical protein